MSMEVGAFEATRHRLGGNVSRSRSSGTFHCSKMPFWVFYRYEI